MRDPKVIEKRRWLREHGRPEPPLCGCGCGQRTKGGEFCKGHYMRLPKYRKMASDNWKGDNNPLRKYPERNPSFRPEVQEKIRRKLTGRKNPWTVEFNKRPEVRKTRGKHMKLPKYRKMASDRFKRLWREASPEKREAWIANNPMKNPEIVRVHFLENEEYRRNHKAAMNRPEVKHKLSVKALQNWGKNRDKMLMAMAKGKRSRPTGLEKLFISFCKKYNLSFRYIGDGDLWIGNNPAMNPDFVHISLRLFLETYGSYWHDPEQEENRVKRLNALGWECLVVWDHEFDDEERLLRKIQNVVGGCV